MAQKILVIIPTYNELENIQKLIPDILGRYNKSDVLIVDDNSPDGTGDYVEELSKTSERVKLINGIRYCLCRWIQICFAKKL